MTFLKAAIFGALYAGAAYAGWRYMRDRDYDSDDRAAALIFYVFLWPMGLAASIIFFIPRRMWRVLYNVHTESQRARESARYTAERDAAIEHERLRDREREARRTRALEEAVAFVPPTTTPEPSWNHIKRHRWNHEVEPDLTGPTFVIEDEPPTIPAKKVDITDESDPALRGELVLEIQQGVPAERTTYVYAGGIRETVIHLTPEQRAGLSVGGPLPRIGQRTPVVG